LVRELTYTIDLRLQTITMIASAFCNNSIIRTLDADVMASEGLELVSEAAEEAEEEASSPAELVADEA
jgi:hypothetical protein